MEITNNNLEYTEIGVLSNDFGSKENRETLLKINDVCMYYGVQLQEQDKVMLSDSFKQDSNFYFQELYGNLDLGSVKMIHDKVNRKIRFFQNNEEIYSISFDKIDMTAFRANIPLFFTRLCNYYFPLREVRTTYTTEGVFNFDFPISGNAKAVVVNVFDIKNKDLYLSYIKSPIPVNKDYLPPMEIITSVFNGNERIIINSIESKWNNEVTIGVTCEPKFMIVKEYNTQEKKIIMSSK